MGNAQTSSSIETMARSLTTSDSRVTKNIVTKPATVDGIVNKFVSNVPNLRRHQYGKAGNHIEERYTPEMSQWKRKISCRRTVGNSKHHPAIFERYKVWGLNVEKNGEWVLTSNIMATNHNHRQPSKASLLSVLPGYAYRPWLDHLSEHGWRW